MPETRWRLVGLTDLTGRVVRSLDVNMTVDTTAPSVVGAIERAAVQSGIVLLPVQMVWDDDPEPEAVGA